MTNPVDIGKELGKLVRETDATKRTIKAGDIMRYVQHLEANQKPEEPFFERTEKLTLQFEFPRKFWWQRLKEWWWKKREPRGLFYVPSGVKVKLMSDVNCDRIWLGEGAELDTNGYRLKTAKSLSLPYGTIKHTPSSTIERCTVETAEEKKTKQK